YQMEMSSQDIRPYLVLKGPKGDLLVKEDAGNKRSARIAYTAAEDRVYLLQAFAADGGLGAYTILVREGKAGPGQGGAAKVDPIVREVGKDGFSLTSALTAADGRDAKRPQCPARIYQVKLVANQKYVIDMKSTAIDSYLRLEDADGKQLA